MPGSPLSDRPAGPGQPLLSVCLITYNQAATIKDAMEGILMQRVDFPWELIIADDCSTDGTREILLAYQKQHPDLIRLILQETNVGPARNWMDLVTAPRSKYLAYCEGDDFWTDPLKLQKQVGILEADDGVGMVYSKASELHEIERNFSSDGVGADCRSSFELLFRNPIPSLTVVVRTDLYHRYIREVEPEKRNWLMGDYPGWLWLAFNSRIHFMPEVTGTYRVSGESASNTRNVDKRHRFNRASFEIADYFARRYCDPAQYEGFQEARCLFLYISCVKHGLAERSEYAGRLRRLRRLRLRTRLILLVLDDLGLAFAFRIVIKTFLPRAAGTRSLWVLGPRPN